MEFVQLQEQDKVELKFAIPSLRQLLKSDSLEIRQVAAEALRKIDPPTDGAGIK